jgi:RNA 2',3'-cyclic 3'-phosphodiesterase
MMLRSFIAVEIPAEIQSAISHTTASLKTALPKPMVRWVVPQNLHLTLKFLGDVSPSNLERLAEALGAETSKQAPFNISVSRIGAFPTSRRARVIWIGLDVPPALSALQRGVEAVAARLGYAPENRPFSAHLTIGRVSESISFGDLAKICSALEKTQVGALGTIHVEAVHIFKSDLQPGGSVYEHLYALPLKII